MKNLYSPPSSSYQEQRKNWIRYLCQSDSDQSLSTTDQLRLSLAEFFYKLNFEESFHLYHFTLTYKPAVEHEYTIDRVQSFYIKFHTEYFLPLILGTKNFQTAKFKSIQPRVMSFLDEHHHDKFTSIHEPSRLHHHAILAIHPDHQPILDHYIGENKFSIVKSENSPYLTCHLVLCDAFRVLYASKMFYKYPDFLSFPDKTYRTRQKYRNTKHTKISHRKIENTFRKLNASNALRMQRLKINQSQFTVM